MRCRTCEIYEFMGFGQACPCEHHRRQEMHPPVKDQRDIGADNPTLDASDGAIIERQDGEVIENKDMARQEFAQEADINYMLGRFGVVPERGKPIFGEWDDTIDLQTALTATAEARAAYHNLPEELRQKFSSMEEMQKAYHEGHLVIKDGDAPEKPKSETEILRERIDALQARLPIEDRNN